MKKFLFCTPLFLLLSFAVHGQNKARKLLAVTPESAAFSSERLKRIDTMLTGWVTRGRTNGAVALLLRDGKMVYHKAFG